jgi:hypothetical protein
LCDLPIPKDRVTLLVLAGKISPAVAPIGEIMQGNTLFKEVVVTPENREFVWSTVIALEHWVLRFNKSLIYIPLVKGSFLNKS